MPSTAEPLLSASSPATTVANRPDTRHATLDAVELDTADSETDGGDFEMEAMGPVGHRRRRSSLAGPAQPSASRRRSPRPRAQSIRNTSSGRGEGKISEEGGKFDARDASGADEDELSSEDLHDDEETGLTGADRQRKRRKRRRNTQLDQRIARERISAEEKEEADRSVLKRLLVNLSLIGSWYFFSLCISLVRSQQPPKVSCRDAC